MKSMMLPVAALTIATVCGTVIGQQPATRSSRTTERPANPLFDNPPSPVISELSVAKGSTTVGKLLPILKEKAPDFEYVVEPGPWEDCVVPEMKLNDVLLSQVIAILSSFCPNLSYTTFPGAQNRQPVYVFRNRGTGSNPDIRVQAFALGPILSQLPKPEGLATPERTRKLRDEGLTHVLNLIENTVKEATDPNGPPAKVSLHTETETVIVKGTPEQVRAVSQTLDTFRPSVNSFQLDRLNEQLRTAKAQIDSLHDELLKREAEAVELKVRLEAAQRKNEADSKH